MSAREKCLLLLAAVLAAVCGFVMARFPEARPWLGSGSQQGGAAAEGARPAVNSFSVAGDSYRRVVVDIEIPARDGEAPKQGMAAHCPATIISNSLGVEFSQYRGLVVGAVQAGGPAEQAGIQPGDMLGQGGICPRTLLSRFAQGTKPKCFEWALLRPRNTPVDEGHPTP